MNTGIPNGRAILTPGLGSAGAWRLGSPGVMPATWSMLRPGRSGQHCHAAPVSRSAARRAPEITATVGPVPYPPGMGDEATGAADLGPAVPGAPDEAPVTEGSRTR